MTGDVRDLPVVLTIDDAARHLGVTRATVLRYIRDGLPTYGVRGDYVHRDELLEAFRRRRQRLLGSQVTRRTA